jgi:FlaA1/EpsC-like NDP-sugar epimerase
MFRRILGARSGGINGPGAAGRRTRPWKLVKGIRLRQSLKTFLRRLPGRVLLAAVFTAAFYLAFWLRFEGRISDDHWRQLTQTIGCVVVVKLLVFWRFRLPSGWRSHVTFHEMGALVEAATISSLLMALGDYLLLPDLTLPRSVFLMDWGVTVLLFGGMRAVTRLVQERYQPWFVSGNKVRALIVGADDAGEALLRAIHRNRELPYDVVGFVDDHRALHGTHLAGVPVLGATSETCKLARSRIVQEVLIAADAMPGRRVRQLVDDCRQHGIAVKVLPSFEQLIRGQISLRTRDVSIEDLLRREPVALDQADIRQWMTGKVIMVTGSSGSIGSEICRQLLPFQPARLVLVDRAENAQFFLDRELRKLCGSIELEICIADINDQARMRALFARCQPEIVFHAAAYKHVPMMEANPGEAVKNNVQGTRCLADLANAAGVQSFVMISTDKAVNPSSVMGACKRLAEEYVQSFAGRSACRFVTVRFGNVLDSSGSVVPIFREQIARGGPVTVTDPRMQRYFMTIPEAAQLVIQAGAMGRGGEIFVLDMGEPLRIVDLARDMIRLSGLREGEDIEIVFTGPRPGEKLVEELHGEGETQVPTRHPKIVVANTEPRDAAEVRAAIERLTAVIEQPPAVVIAELQRAVSGYHCPEVSAVLPLRVFQDQADGDAPPATNAA